MLERTFIFYPDWLDFIERINDDKDKLDLYNIIVQYGCHGEYSNENPMMIAVFESLIKNKIDIAQGRYEEKVSAGKSFGRKKVVNDDNILTLAQTGMKAKDIAAELGLSEAAVYHSDGWKNRNKNL